MNNDSATASQAALLTITVLAAASNRPDSKILDRFATADNAYVAVATLITAAVLSDCMIPALSPALPDRSIRFSQVT